MTQADERGRHKIYKCFNYQKKPANVILNFAHLELNNTDREY